MEAKPEAKREVCCFKESTVAAVPAAICAAVGPFMAAVPLVKRLGKDEDTPEAMEAVGVVTEFAVDGADGGADRFSMDRG